jgi:hypothetical protein
MKPTQRRRVRVPFDFSEISTGGNCTALEYRVHANAYALLTQHDDPTQPEYTDAPVTVGLYRDSDGDQLASFVVPSFADAVKLVRRIDMVDGDLVACSFCQSVGHHVINCLDRPPIKDMKGSV